MAEHSYRDLDVLQKSLKKTKTNNQQHATKNSFGMENK
jgi:hypothetical protein